MEHAACFPEIFRLFSIDPSVCSKHAAALVKHCRLGSRAWDLHIEILGSVGYVEYLEYVVFVPLHSWHHAACMLGHKLVSAAHACLSTGNAVRFNHIGKLTEHTLLPHLTSKNPAWKICCHLLEDIKITWIMHRSEHRQRLVSFFRRWFTSIHLDCVGILQAALCVDLRKKLSSKSARHC